MQQTGDDEMRAFRFFLLLFVAAQVVTRQAPGDEDSLCLESFPIRSVNMEILMSSFRYEDLLGTYKSPWITLPNNSVREIHVQSYVCAPVRKNGQSEHRQYIPTVRALEFKQSISQGRLYRLIKLHSCNTPQSGKYLWLKIFRGWSNQIATLRASII